MRTPLPITVLAALGAALLSGCNIVGPAYLLVHGPEKTAALYALDPARPTVVFVDDPGNVMPRRSLRAATAASAEETLLREGTLKDMISAESAMLAAGKDRAGKPLPITEIGRAVGAQVVIYARVDEFGLSPDGQTFAPSMKLRVKVLDTAKDSRLWPDDPPGYPVVVSVLPGQGTVPTGSTDRIKAEDALAAEAGVSVASLFFKHEATHGVTVPK